MVDLGPVYQCFAEWSEDIYSDHLNWGSHGSLNHAHWPNAGGK